MTLNPSTIATVRRVEPQRDRWGRPLVVPPTGGDPVAYQRVTTLAKMLDDTAALGRWQQRQAIIGLASRPDLVMLASTTPVDDRAAWDRIVEQATEAAATTAAANTGTAVHLGTEMLDSGMPLDRVPALVRDRVAAYRQLTDDLEILAVETFVVVDELRVAGTFDRLVRLPDGRTVIADIKTSKASAVRYAAGSWAVQLAAYSHGRRYDVDTGERSPIDVAARLDPNEGVVIHLPADGLPALIPLNLAWGWEAAKLAARVRAYRKTPFIIDERNPA